MTNDMHIPWSVIVELSASMLSLAREEQWEALASLEKKRNKLIYAYFDQADAKREPAMLEKGIHNVLEFDNQILQICQFRKNNVSDKLSRFRDSRRAKNAYKQNSY